MATEAPTIDGAPPAPPAIGVHCAEPSILLQRASTEPDFLLVRETADSKQLQEWEAVGYLRVEPFASRASNVYVCFRADGSGSVSVAREEPPDGPPTPGGGEPCGRLSMPWWMDSPFLTWDKEFARRESGTVSVSNREVRITPDVLVGFVPELEGGSISALHIAVGLGREKTSELNEGS